MRILLQLPSIVILKLSALYSDLKKILKYGEMFKNNFYGFLALGDGKHNNDPNSCSSLFLLGDVQVKTWTELIDNCTANI